MEAPKSDEPSSPQEIIIPPEQMKPLGKALNTFAQEPLNRIRSNLNAVPNGVETEMVEFMRGGETELTEFFRKLEKSRQVRAVPIIGMPGEYDLVPSDEESDTPSLDRPVTMDEPTTRAFASGLNHMVNQHLQVFAFGTDTLERSGFSQPSDNIHQALSAIGQEVKSFMGARGVRITPDLHAPSYQVIKP